MHYICTILLIFIMMCFSFAYLDSHQSELVKHDARLLEHNDAMTKAITRIHTDLENTKKLTLDNSKKLDILLNIATNVSVFSDCSKVK